MSKTKTRKPIEGKLILLLNLSYASFHEAGHTLLCLLNFSKVNPVKIQTIDSEEDTQYGETTYESIFEYKDFQDAALFNFKIHSEISMLYAGQEAERYLFRETSGSNKFPSFLKNGSHFDNKQAYQLIKKYVNVLPGKDRLLFKKRIINDTHKTLHENWDDVKLIAHTLFKKKKLNHYELKKLLTTKSKNKDFWKVQFKGIDKIFSKKGKIDAAELRVILGIS